MSVDDDLREIMDRTVAALTCLVEGEPEAFKALYSHEPDVTVFGGFGAYERGWGQVSQNIELAASRFRGGHLEIETLAVGKSGDLAYTIWIERGEVQVEGRDEPGALAVRVTHIFRYEDSAWKLIHRHGDPIVEKTEAQAILKQ
jgi:ketosteroid isomerase-like protein